MRQTAFTTGSEEETIQLGERLGAMFERPKVVLLIGNLGAGKTTLAKGIAAGAGAARPDDVSSPTFPLIHEYGDPPEVFHVDLYRLDSMEEVRTLGLEEYFARPALVVMEWAERFPAILPEERIEIRIEALPDESRRIEVTELP
jgi:tRNA threonylcarbamoyladenosine biosynthesis protein TsaE